MSKPRTPRQTWNTVPSTIEETLQAVRLQQRWEAKTGRKVGYAEGIIVTTEFCVDLCERLLALETGRKP